MDDDLLTHLQNYEANFEANFDENNNWICVNSDDDVIPTETPERTVKQIAQNATQYLPEDLFGYNKQESSEGITADRCEQFAVNTGVGVQPFKFKLTNSAENTSLGLTNNISSQISANYDAYDYTKYMNDDHSCNFVPEEYYANEFKYLEEDFPENLENPVLKYLAEDTPEKLQKPAESKLENSFTNNYHGNTTFVMDEYSKHLEVGILKDDLPIMQNEFSKYFIEDSLETNKKVPSNHVVDSSAFMRRDAVEYNEEETSTEFSKLEPFEHNTENSVSKENSMHFKHESVNNFEQPLAKGLLQNAIEIDTETYPEQMEKDPSEYVEREIDSKASINMTENLGQGITQYYEQAFVEDLEEEGSPELVEYVLENSEYDEVIEIFEEDLSKYISDYPLEYFQEEEECNEYKNEEIQQEPTDYLSEYNYGGFDNIMQKPKLTEGEITTTIDSEQILDWNSIGQYIYIEENDIEDADDIDEIELVDCFEQLQASDDQQSDDMVYFISAEEDSEENITNCNGNHLSNQNDEKITFIPVKEDFKENADSSNENVLTKKMNKEVCFIPVKEDCKKAIKNSIENVILTNTANNNEMPTIPNATNNEVPTIVNAVNNEVPKEEMKKKIKCSHCDKIFNEFEFESHICEFNKDKQLIKLDEEPEDEESDLLESFESDCLRLLGENQTKLRRLVKEDLKFDLDDNDTVDEKEDDQNSCSVCDRKFVHPSGLARHIVNHANDIIPPTMQNLKQLNGPRVVTTCSVCHRVFFENEFAIKHLFKNHVNSFKEENDFQKQDKLMLPYQNFLNEAIRVYNISLIKTTSNCEPKTYLKCIILNCVLQCEFCEFFFYDVTSLLNHTQYHNPSLGYQCHSCNFNAPTSKEIVHHWQTECVCVKENIYKNFILPTFFVCNVCENKFISSELLHKHRYEKYHFFPRLNGTVLEISCEFCGDVFQRLHELLEHNLNEHQKKAKKEEVVEKFRQFLCEICGKSYTQSSHLWQHLRFHKGIKPFVCKVPDCQRRFTIRPDLDDHTRKCHTGERPYHCLVCGKRFLTGSVFYQHRLIHRNERRYGCEKCGKRFYRADALKNHHRIHTGEKPYLCMYCLKSFRQQGDRDKHIRARHPNSEANAIIMMQMKNLQERAGTTVPVMDVFKELNS